MGTELEVEGLQAYRATSVLAGGSSLVNSLEGINTSMLVNGAMCFVSATGDVYRWDPTSTLTAVGSVVVLPNGQAPGTPGRWILETLSGEDRTIIDVGVSGTQQNWLPGGDPSLWDRARILLTNTGGGGDLIIGGLVAPLTPQSPHVKRIVKSTSQDNIIISNDDGGSDIPNRGRAPTGGNTISATWSSFDAIYDRVTLKWYYAAAVPAA